MVMYEAVRRSEAIPVRGVLLGLGVEKDEVRLRIPVRVDEEDGEERWDMR